MKIDFKEVGLAVAASLEKHFGGTASDCNAEVESETAIVKNLDSESRRALFVVLEPQEGETTTDLHQDTYTVSDVEKACISFNTHCMKANLFHQIEIEEATIEQSFITPSDFNTEDGRSIKKGTWLQWWHFPEDNEDSEALWNLVKSGEITGVSIGARASFTNLEE